MTVTEEIGLRLRDEDGTDYTKGFNNGLRAAQSIVSRAPVGGEQPYLDALDWAANFEPGLVDEIRQRVMLNKRASLKGNGDA